MAGDYAKRIRALIAREEPRLRAIAPDTAAAVRTPQKWSRAQVLGHLIDSAANNHQRFVRGQLVQSLTMPDYAQDQWVAVQAYDHEPWSDLIELWVSLNRHLAHVLERMPAAMLTHTCTIVSSGGEPSTPEPLEYIAEHYLEHLEHHLGQV